MRVGRNESAQHCYWPLNADPSGTAAYVQIVKFRKDRVTVSENDVFDATPTQVLSAIEEVLKFTDDPNLENLRFVTLASAPQPSGGIWDRLTRVFRDPGEPYLQLACSSYGWFIEFLSETNTPILRTKRNTVPEEVLKDFFIRYLENPTDLPELQWRDNHQPPDAEAALMTLNVRNSVRKRPSKNFNNSS